MRAQEPQRSRASELRADVRIAPKDPAAGKGCQSAQAALEALVAARKLRKQAEADQQRLCRHQQKWEKLCEAPFEEQSPDACGVCSPATFWQRHSFGRSSRRTVPQPVQLTHRPRDKVCMEMFRRSPVHANDAIKSVIEKPSAKPNELRADSAKDFLLEASFDWSDPCTLAYNSGLAGSCRQEKWAYQRQLFAELETPSKTTFGFDEEDMILMRESQALDRVAGGGVNLAKHVLALKDDGAAVEEFKTKMVQFLCFKTNKGHRYQRSKKLLVTSNLQSMVRLVRETTKLGRI